jgi:pimeloyl-ACP methyl ester carboxylesterase
MKRVKLGNGIELDVQDEGPRDAPVLIFLHGFPDSHRTWRHQIAHFSDRFRCIAPDQRGYRGSSKPKGIENYTPDKLIGDIFLLAAALDVKDFTVVGHDWGGAIAWGVALMGQGTGRVTRAVIANAPHPVLFPKLLYTNPVQRAASQYFRIFRDPASDALVEQFGLGGVLLKAFGDVP